VLEVANATRTFDGQAVGKSDSLRRWVLMTEKFTNFRPAFING